ncbi:carboxylating nicotinate-nucleotide diphosphorylase [Candidatus Methanodesulfokora washburnensis]|jgi:nicotinate-nucleotide pyrophosphorylase (carboxylating)|uniref:Nicotinate-nucleotide pyrophosphorylase [carboxylating] n=1 Tax=Candidatus Methanodesulfokora washburnensis TaxID=2478471 RepID=A0A3R9QC27_9CREN|nr:carboxylating nicotinate-nucleotide diphosphorylase [Candidatus Methanodesulfokores washburnensis]RSN72876.1 carboxylating nicotinate-nucleotide diphosphorylase [Candidatus Methanodesulfokores washburnensis]
MVEEVAFKRLLEFLEEDIPLWDTTSAAIVPEGAVVRAYVVAKQRGVVACIEDVVYFLKRLGLEVKELARDGDTVDRGSSVLEIVGNARTVLAVERTILNILMHCSGVATEVRRLVDMVRRVNQRVRIAATRKTLPGLRYFEKKAVAVGGGDTHRLSLSDAILIKDNHVRIVESIEEAVKLAKARASFAHKVEIEVSTVEDAVKAAEAGADIVMLDNMSPQEVARVVEELRRRGLRNKVVIEVSGGVTAENIGEYAKLDVDVISCGYITLSAKALDMSLEIVEVIKKR